LNFEERLALELNSARIIGRGGVVRPVDCPILQDLEEVLIAESDKWLRIVREMMEAGKEKLKREHGSTAS
jgi:hypothetical protein